MSEYKNTVIVSAFPACGKTYLFRNQDKLLFSYLGEKIHFSFCDSDSSKYEKTEDWIKRYVDDIEKKCGTIDFLFISQHQEVLKELEVRGIPFVVVAPNNSDWISDDERRIIKQQWFGRFILRDNSHIKDFPSWLKLLKDKYDEWTSIESLTKYNPESLVLLNQDQYIKDIIEELYWDKETYTSTYCLCRYGE